MAGLGFKDFQVGEVLTAADVDGYLMQQSVMRFANAGARGSALGTAVGTGVPLAEGMVAYLDDVNQVQVFDGTSWATTGKVLQVVSAVKTDTFSTTSASFVDTGLEVSLTCSSNTSKVLLIATMFVASSAADFVYTRLTAGATAVLEGDASAGDFITYGAYYPAAGDTQNTQTLTVLYSPASTSAITYKAQIARATGTGYLNRRSTDSVRGASSIIAIEVAA